MKVIITFKYELIKNSRAHNWPAKRKATVRKWSKNRKLRSLYPVVNIKSVCVLMSEETVRSAWYDTCTEREANVIRSGSELGDVALYVLFSIWYSCFPDGDSESKTWFVCVCVCVCVCTCVYVCLTVNVIVQLFSITKQQLPRRPSLRLSCSVILWRY